MSKERFLAQVAQRYPGSTVLAVATVLHEGWELDNYVAVLDAGDGDDDGGEPIVVTTDHGRLTRTEPSVLRDAIARHERATYSCAHALLALSRDVDGGNGGAPA